MIQEQEQIVADSGTDAHDVWASPPVSMALLAPLEVTADLAGAIAEAAKLPVEDQNYLAFRIMEEIAEEKKWTDSFASSLDVLDRLAAKALQEDAEGRTRPLEELL